jgi:hypothetical protein
MCQPPVLYMHGIGICIFQISASSSPPQKFPYALTSKQCKFKFEYNDYFLLLG